MLKHIQTLALTVAMLATLPSVAASLAGGSTASAGTLVGPCTNPACPDYKFYVDNRGSNITTVTGVKGGLSRHKSYVKTTSTTFDFLGASAAPTSTWGEVSDCSHITITCP